MYVIVLFIGSLAPCAPFLPPLLPKANGDVVFAGAFIPVAAIGTSLLMPIFAPLLVKGIELSVMSLLKPLFIISAVTFAYWRFDQDICQQCGR